MQPHPLIAFVHMMSGGQLFPALGQTSPLVRRLSGIFAVALAVTGIHGILQLANPSAVASRPSASSIVEQTQPATQGNYALSANDRNDVVRERALTMPPPSNALGDASISDDYDALDRPDGCVGSNCRERNNRATTVVEEPKQAGFAARPRRARTGGHTQIQTASLNNVSAQVESDQLTFVHRPEGPAVTNASTERSALVNILDTPNRGE